MANKKGDFDDYDFDDGDEFFPLDDEMYDDLEGGEGESSKGVIGYFKNVAKSVKNLAVDLAKEFLPDAVDYTEQTTTALQDVGTKIGEKRDAIKEKGGEAVDKFKENATVGNIKKTAKEKLNQAKEKVKTGNIYGGSSEGGDFNFDDMDDFDDDDDEEGEYDDEDSAQGSIGPQYAAVKLASAVGKSSKSQTDALANTMIETTAANMQSNATIQTQLYKKQMIAGEVHQIQTNNILKNIAQNLFQVTSFLSHEGTMNVASGLEYRAKSLAMTEDVLGLLKDLSSLQTRSLGILTQEEEDALRESETNNKSSMEKVFGRGFDMSNYIANVGENIQGMFDNSMVGQIGTMYGTMKDMNSMTGKDTGPLGMIKDMFVQSIPGMLLGDNSKDTLDKVNNSIAGAPATLIGKFNSLAENSDNGFLRTLGEALGVDTYMNEKNTMGLDAQSAKAGTAFDKQTHKTINSVIPALLASIESALTGHEEKVFNYAEGKFSTKKAMREGMQTASDDTLRSNTYFNRQMDRNEVAALSIANEDKETYGELKDKDIKDSLKKFNENVVKSGTDFNPRRLLNEDETEYQESILQGIDDENMRQLLKRMASTMDQEGLAQFNTGKNVVAVKRKETNEAMQDYHKWAGGDIVSAEHMSDRVMSGNKQQLNTMASKLGLTFDKSSQEWVNSAQGGKIAKGTKEYNSMNDQFRALRDQINFQQAGAQADVDVTGVQSLGRNVAGDKVNFATTPAGLKSIYDLLLHGIIVYPKEDRKAIGRLRSELKETRKNNAIKIDAEETEKALKVRDEERRTKEMNASLESRRMTNLSSLGPEKDTGFAAFLRKAAGIDPLVNTGAHKALTAINGFLGGSAIGVDADKYGASGSKMQEYSKAEIEAAETRRQDIANAADRKKAMFLGNGKDKELIEENARKKAAGKKLTFGEWGKGLLAKGRTKIAGAIDTDSDTALLNRAFGKGNMAKVGEKISKAREKKEEILNKGGIAGVIGRKVDKVTTKVGDTIKNSFGKTQLSKDLDNNETKLGKAKEWFKKTTNKVKVGWEDLKVALDTEWNGEVGRIKIYGDDKEAIKAVTKKIERDGWHAAKDIDEAKAYVIVNDYKPTEDEQVAVFERSEELKKEGKTLHELKPVSVGADSIQKLDSSSGMVGWTSRAFLEQQKNEAEGPEDRRLADSIASKKEKDAKIKNVEAGFGFGESSSGILGGSSKDSIRGRNKFTNPTISNTGAVHLHSKTNTRTAPLIDFSHGDTSKTKINVDLSTVEKLLRNISDDTGKILKDMGKIGGRKGKKEKGEKKEGILKKTVLFLPRLLGKGVKGILKLAKEGALFLPKLIGKAIKGAFKGGAFLIKKAFIVGGKIIKGAFRGIGKLVKGVFSLGKKLVKGAFSLGGKVIKGAVGGVKKIVKGGIGLGKKVVGGVKGLFKKKDKKKGEEAKKEESTGETAVKKPGLIAKAFGLGKTVLKKTRNAVGGAAKGVTSLAGTLTKGLGEALGNFALPGFGGGNKIMEADIRAIRMILERQFGVIDMKEVRKLLKDEKPSLGKAVKSLGTMVGTIGKKALSVPGKIFKNREKKDKEKDKKYQDLKNNISNDVAEAYWKEKQAGEGTTGHIKDKLKKTADSVGKLNKNKRENDEDYVYIKDIAGEEAAESYWEDKHPKKEKKTSGLRAFLSKKFGKKEEKPEEATGTATATEEEKTESSTATTTNVEKEEKNPKKEKKKKKKRKKSTDEIKQNEEVDGLDANEQAKIKTDKEEKERDEEVATAELSTAAGIAILVEQGKENLKTEEEQGKILKDIKKSEEKQAKNNALPGIPGAPGVPGGGKVPLGVKAAGVAGTAVAIASVAGMAKTAIEAGKATKKKAELLKSDKESKFNTIMGSGDNYNAGGEQVNTSSFDESGNYIEGNSKEMGARQAGLSKVGGGIAGMTMLGKATKWGIDKALKNPKSLVSKGAAIGKKLVGFLKTILEKFFKNPKIAKELGTKGPKVMGGFLGKIGQSAAGKNVAALAGKLAKMAGPIGIAITITQLVYDFFSGMQAANRYFKLPKGIKPTAGQRLVSGLVKTLSGLAFGLIPVEWLVNFLWKFLGDENTKKEQAKGREFGAKRAKILGVSPDRLTEFETKGLFDLGDKWGANILGFGKSKEEIGVFKEWKNKKYKPLDKIFKNLKYNYKAVFKVDVDKVQASENKIKVVEQFREKYLKAAQDYVNKYKLGYLVPGYKKKGKESEDNTDIIEDNDGENDIEAGDLSTVGSISKEFSPGEHSGTDIAADSGTPIKSSKAGVIQNVGQNDALGNTVAVKAQDSNLITTVGHVETPKVTAGQMVKPNQTIAKVGNTGSDSTGPHAHIAQTDGKNMLNPVVNEKTKYKADPGVVKAATGGKDDKVGGGELNYSKEMYESMQKHQAFVEMSQKALMGVQFGKEFLSKVDAKNAPDSKRIGDLAENYWKKNRKNTVDAQAERREGKKKEAVGSIKGPNIGDMFKSIGNGIGDLLLGKKDEEGNRSGGLGELILGKKDEEGNRSGGVAGGISKATDFLFGNAETGEKSVIGKIGGLITGNDSKKPENEANSTGRINTSTSSSIPDKPVMPTIPSIPEEKPQSAVGKVVDTVKGVGEDAVAFIKRVLAKFEGEKILRGYIPGKQGPNKGRVLGKSGVTIGTGLDLGQQNIYDLKNMGIRQDLIDRFKPYLEKRYPGKDGWTAERALQVSGGAKLAINDAEADYLGDKVERSYISKARKKVGEELFDRLPKEPQAALVSAGFHMGPGVLSVDTVSPATRKAINKMKSKDFIGASKEWSNPANWSEDHWYKSRRLEEASLIAKGASGGGGDKAPDNRNVNTVAQAEKAVNSRDVVNNKNDNKSKDVDFVRASWDKKGGLITGSKIPIRDSGAFASMMNPKISIPANGNAYLVHPFGKYLDSGEKHAGIDLGSKAGQTRNLAVTDGVVVREQRGFRPNWNGDYLKTHRPALAKEYEGSTEGFGNAVTIRTPDGAFVTYGHQLENYVKEGDKVVAGQPIGIMGNTGNSFGKHLHLQITKNNKVHDPIEFLRTGTYSNVAYAGTTQSSTLTKSHKKGRREKEEGIGGVGGEGVATRKRLDDSDDGMKGALDHYGFTREQQKRLLKDGYTYDKKPAKKIGNVTIVKEKEWFIDKSGKKLTPDELKDTVKNSKWTKMTPLNPDGSKAEEEEEDSHIKKDNWETAHVLNGGPSTVASTNNKPRDGWTKMTPMNPDDDGSALVADREIKPNIGQYMSSEANINTKKGNWTAMTPVEDKKKTVPEVEMIPNKVPELTPTGETKTIAMISPSNEKATITPTKAINSDEKEADRYKTTGKYGEIKRTNHNEDRVEGNAANSVVRKNNIYTKETYKTGYLPAVSIANDRYKAGIEPMSITDWTKLNSEKREEIITKLVKANDRNAKKAEEAKKIPATLPDNEGEKKEKEKEKVTNQEAANAVVRKNNAEVKETYSKGYYPAIKIANSKFNAHIPPMTLTEWGKLDKEKREEIVGKLNRANERNAKKAEAAKELGIKNDNKDNNKASTADSTAKATGKVDDVKVKTESTVPKVTSKPNTLTVKESTSKPTINPNTKVTPEKKPTATAKVANPVTNTNNAVIKENISLKTVEKPMSLSNQTNNKTAKVTGKLAESPIETESKEMMTILNQGISIMDEIKNEQSRHNTVSEKFYVDVGGVLLQMVKLLANNSRPSQSYSKPLNSGGIYDALSV